MYKNTYPESSTTTYNALRDIMVYSTFYDYPAR